MSNLRASLVGLAAAIIGGAALAAWLLGRAAGWW